MPERPLNEDQLQRSLRRRSLTFAQRRKHLVRLERAIAAEEVEMDSIRRRSKTELAMLVGVLAFVVVGFVVWAAINDDSDNADEPSDLVLLAQATLTARELEANPTATQTAIAVIPASPTPMPVASGFVCPARPLETNLAAGVPVNAQQYPDWYANDNRRLWAGPLHLGAFLPTGFPHASSLWFANGLMTISWYGTPEPVILSGSRLDGDSVIKPIEPTRTFNRIQWTDFTIPEPGCWALVGRAGEEMIEIIVEVLPIDERPDVLLIQNYYDARPYEAPASCAVSPWTGPDIRGGTYAHFWLEAGGIEAEVPGLFIANREQSMGILGEDVEAGIEVSARSLDSVPPQSFTATTTIWNTDSRLANFSFPTAGCWELEMETETLSATFVVYAYPLECEPFIVEEEYVSDCDAP